MSAGYVPFAGIETSAEGSAEYVLMRNPHLYAAVVNDLTDHRGQWRHPGQAVASMLGFEMDCDSLSRAVGYVIAEQRRLGAVIEGDPQLGYCYRGPIRRRYVRLGPRWLWAPVTGYVGKRWRKRREGEQLTMMEAAG